MFPTTLSELVAHAAHAWPENVAVVGLGVTLSWSDVEQRTRQMAEALLDLGVEPGDRVAVLRPKGHESFEAVHAILRAGAIVVPLDPMSPADAILPVLVDSGAIAIIGHATSLKRTAVLACPTLRFALATGAIATLDATIPVVGIDTLPATGSGIALPTVTPDDPAYLIYTSGSTGTPKGILHTHASGLAYAVAAVDGHRLGPADRLAAMTGLHFDMSTLELYAAPLAGASIVQMSEPHLRFPASFTERAAEERTTVWYAVTFLLQQILDRGALEERDWSSLRMVMFAGEVFPASDLRRLMAALPGVEFVNVYGPAEVNGCNVFTLPGPPEDDQDVPIGPALGAAEMLVVDDDENPVPPGTMGVLWVSAPTRMSGYWNRPDLTDATRRPHPAGPDWYVTGDLVSIDAAGVAWFHGRSDHQVKLRGIRVELEGVESTLTNHPDVQHAVTGPWADVPGTLAVTAVVAEGASLDLRTLQRWASKRLPAVAIPAQLFTTQSLPQTSSGKIDRKAVRAGMARPSIPTKETPCQT